MKNYLIYFAGSPEWLNVFGNISIIMIGIWAFIMMFMMWGKQIIAGVVILSSVFCIALFLTSIFIKIGWLK